MISFQESNLVLAQKLADKLSPIQTVSSILLYGSIGKGYSDQFSDIDLVILCTTNHEDIGTTIDQVNKLFPEYLLQFKQQELSVLHFDHYPSKKHPDDHFYQSLRAQCAILHKGRIIDTTVRLISIDVVKKLTSESKHDIYRYQTLMQYVIDTKTLFTRDDSFESWKKSTASFSTFAPELYAAFITHCIEKIDYYLKGEIPDSIARNDRILRNYELGKCIILFLNILYAINDRCLAYPKWEHEDIKKLTRQPVNTHLRLEQVIHSQDPLLIKEMMSELSL